MTKILGRLDIKGTGTTSSTNSLFIEDNLGNKIIKIDDGATINSYSRGSTNAGDHNWIGYNSSEVATSYISPDGQFFSTQTSVGGFFFIGTVPGGGTNNGIYRAGSVLSGGVNSGYMKVQAPSSSINVAGYSASVFGSLLTVAQGSIAMNQVGANIGSSTAISGGSTPGQVLRSFAPTVAGFPGSESPLITMTNEMDSDTSGLLYSLVGMRHRDAGGSIDSIQHAISMRSNSNVAADGDSDLLFWTQRTGSSVTLMSLNNKTGSLTLANPPIFPVFTVAGLPTAATYDGGIVIVSDEVDGRTIATSDGTNWRRVKDGAVVA